MSEQDLFVIEPTDDLDRFAIAKDDLKAGDVVLSEKPFAYGPKSETYCVCLGCFEPVDCSVLCSRCSWPVCGPDCENRKCHKDFECEIFSKSGNKFTPVENPIEVCLQYETITPLRVLLAKERDSKRWDEQVKFINARNNVRRERPVWEFNQRNIVEFLRGPCKLDRFSEELIHTVCGILEIYSVDARTPTGYLIRCLYPKFGLFSHDCVANVHYTSDCKGTGDDEDYRFIVRAAIDIPKGERLSYNYSFPLWPTIIRREFLRERKYFDCTCKRCADKTELGTHNSTLKCNKCDNGIIMPDNPLDDTCEWKCTHCEFKTSAVAVKTAFATIQADIDEVEYIGGPEAIEIREALHRKYRSVLHPKNAYLSVLRSALIQLYGKAEGYTLGDLPNVILERKLELCYQLLEVLDVIEPGRSRIRDSCCLCLGCFDPVDDAILCSKCSWPVCSPDCENRSCHKDYECEIFSNAKIKFQPVEDPTDVCLQYECITPLRVLLAKEKDPKRWDEEIKIMEAHNDIRKEKPIWEFNQHNIVEYLRGPCKLVRFSEELIHTVCGILEINAFEARTPTGYFIRCLFPKLAILSHNCISNIHHAIDCKGNGDPNDYSVTVRAAVEVPKGEQLYSSYTYSLWPTLVRREFLRESKFFDCTCERCSDKTELGTNSSTLKCNKCDNGVILSTNPLDDACEWKCTHCEFKTNGVAVRRVFAAIQADIDAVEYTVGGEGIEARETIYRKYRSVLHPKNSYMSILRSALIQLYGKVDGYTLDDLPDLILERKVELCNQLLEVLDVIEPGNSRIRGITLYELHGPLMVLSKHQYQNDVITKEVFRNELQKAINTLGKSVEILKQEPESLPEGQIAKMAEMAYNHLIKNIDMLVDTA